MNRLIVHMAVPEPRRQVAATMTGLSGAIQEFSIKLTTVPGGASDIDDLNSGYSRPSPWWGASQPISQEICTLMKQSAYELQAGAWYSAFEEQTGNYVEGNTPIAPSDSSFQAFLASVGLEINEEQGQP